MRVVVVASLHEGMGTLSGQFCSTVLAVLVCSDCVC